jgi:hypothetical protein
MKRVSKIALGVAAATGGGASQVALKWQRPNILEIRYDSSARVFKMNARVGEVDIAYQPQPP